MRVDPGPQPNSMDEGGLQEARRPPPGLAPGGCGGPPPPPAQTRGWATGGRMTWAVHVLDGAEENSSARRTSHRHGGPPVRSTDWDPAGRNLASTSLRRACTARRCSRSSRPSEGLREGDQRPRQLIGPAESLQGRLRVRNSWPRAVPSRRVLLRGVRKDSGSRIGVHVHPFGPHSQRQRLGEREATADLAQPSRRHL
jgi:hypothetical protein